MPCQKVSIIVPVYNSEKYLDECIQSILRQEYDDFELLLVDDGSSDKSLSICKEYAKSDSRVIVLEEPNSGVSTARNVGLNNAKGDYIFFCDSDDYISSDCLKQLINTALKFDADLIGAGFKQFLSSSQKVLYLNKVNQLMVMNSLEALNTYGERGSICSFIAPKLFKRSIIDELELRFDTGLFFKEDTAFTISFIERAKTIVSLDRVVYFYRFHNSSATVRLVSNLRTWENRRVATFKILELASKFPGSKFYENVVMDYFDQLEGELAAQYYEKEKDLTKIKMLKNQIRRLIRNERLTRMGIKRKIKHVLLFRCPCLFKLVLFLSRRFRFGLVF